MMIRADLVKFKTDMIGKKKKTMKPKASSLKISEIPLTFN